MIRRPLDGEDSRDLGLQIIDEAISVKLSLQLGLPRRGLRDLAELEKLCKFARIDLTSELAKTSEAEELRREQTARERQQEQEQERAQVRWLMSGRAKAQVSDA